MHLQDQIESFQKLIFSQFHGSANNECKISALVPLVAESYGIYKFITSMLRAMHSCRLRSLLNTNNANLKKHLVTTMLFSHYAIVMILNITVLHVSTTNARIFAT